LPSALGVERVLFEFVLQGAAVDADVMKRISAPMVGGGVTSTILELVIYPAIYMIWRGREFKKVKEKISNLE
jgi:Cu/Ag efflux pump CusA